MNSFRGNYRLLNNVTGWLMFVISSAVYLLTLEPTVSFWDCGEFILSAFRLQVGHPPGAPLFLMMGRIATLFAGGDVTKVAAMVNGFICFMQRIYHNVSFLDDNAPCKKDLWYERERGADSYLACTCKRDYRVTRLYLYRYLLVFSG